MKIRFFAKGKNIVIEPYLVPETNAIANAMPNTIANALGALPLVPLKKWKRSRSRRLARPARSCN